MTRGLLPLGASHSWTHLPPGDHTPTRSRSRGLQVPPEHGKERLLPPLQDARHVQGTVSAEGNPLWHQGAGWGVAGGSRGGARSRLFRFLIHLPAEPALRQLVSAFLPILCCKRPLSQVRFPSPGTRRQPLNRKSQGAHPPGAAEVTVFSGSFRTTCG